MRFCRWNICWFLLSVRGGREVDGRHCAVRAVTTHKFERSARNKPKSSPSWWNIRESVSPSQRASFPKLIATYRNTISALIPQASFECDDMMRPATKVRIKVLISTLCDEIAPREAHAPRTRVSGERVTRHQHHHRQSTSKSGIWRMG